MVRKSVCLITYALLLACLGCQEVITLELPETKPKLVIEGLLTDGPGPHVVRLSTTSDYFYQGPKPLVSGAEVIISDDVGNREVLTEASEGFYLTRSLTGVAGRTYTLEVQYDRQQYKASSRLIPSPRIDSLEYRFVEETPLKEEGYYIYFYGETGKGQINYYRWRVFENDSLHNKKEGYLLGSDEFVKGRINGIEFPFSFDLHDKVKIEMYTLNKDMYDYYNALINLLYNDGGLFSPPPENPPTNIRNLTHPQDEPLGYFQVSAVESETIEIK